MAIRTGTSGTRTQHSPPAAALNVTAAVGIPILLALVGLIARGWGAISWWAAILWGIVAAAAMSLLMLGSQAMGATRMDLHGLLGSMFVRPGSVRARRIGFAVHLANGALLGLGWAYTMALLGWVFTWATGLLWGIVLWGLMLALMTSVGAVHPAIRRGAEPDPGPVAQNFGRFTPVAGLLAHALYGIVLGGLYQATVY